MSIFLRSAQAADAAIAAQGASVNGQLIHVSQEKSQVLLPAAENEASPQTERKVEKFHIVDR